MVTKPIQGLRGPLLPNVKRIVREWMVSALFCMAFIILLADNCLSENYNFDLAEIEKKPYHIVGYAELSPVLMGLDRDSSFYKQRFYDRD